MTDKKLSLSEKTAQQFIAMLEAGTAVWQKPWKPGLSAMPYNMVSGHKYSGLNVFRLLAAGYSDPRWLTFHQAKAAGYVIKKGTKATRIVKYVSYDGKESDEGESDNATPKKKGGLKGFNVFNAAQFEEIEPLEPATQTVFEANQRAESVLKNSGAVIRHGGNKAGYAPSSDTIVLPEKAQFHEESGYYHVALHELAHWTSHESRLNRKVSTNKKTDTYAREELIAEIAAFMVGATLGVGSEPQQSGSYVNGWIRNLKSDPSEIVSATKEAQRIHDLIVSYEGGGESPEPTPKPKKQAPRKAKAKPAAKPESVQVPQPEPTPSADSVMPGIPLSDLTPKKPSKAKARLGAIRDLFSF